MANFIPGNTPLVFPEGTRIVFNSGTWAMYANGNLKVTWIGYAVQGGTQLIELPGAKTRLSPDFNGIKRFVEQRQATACGECGD